MSDQIPADSNELEMIDDVMDNALPDVDNDSAAFEQATIAQAAEVKQPEELTEKRQHEEDPSIWTEFNEPNPHVNLEYPAYKRQKIDPNKPALSALKVSAEEMTKILEARGLLDLDEERVAKLNKEERRLVYLSRTLSAIWQDLYFDNIDKEGNWGQYVVHNEAKLGAGKVRPENMRDPVMAIRASFGQGSVVQIPLWNTGLWISFRAPALQALLDLDQRIRMEKITLGRAANGMAFSNTEVYTVETYMRFALEHVVSVNYLFETADTVEELLTVIRARDYQQVLWGLISAMYPDGYMFRQPCVADNCDHVDEMILNFARLGMVDRDKINAKQALMMASRKTKRDRAWLEEYQREFSFYEKRVSMNDTLTAVLRVPTLQEQITAGHLWVDGIAKATTEAFGHRLAEMDRVRHIMRSGALTNLRQYSHWIAHFEHAIEADTEPRIISDVEDKDRILEMLSESPELSDILGREIMTWIQKSTVSYVGLPKIKCPACQGESTDQSHPHLIPLDIGYIFFTLAAFKISQVEGAAG